MFEIHTNTVRAVARRPLAGVCGAVALLLAAAAVVPAWVNVPPSSLAGSAGDAVDVPALIDAIAKAPAKTAAKTAAAPLPKARPSLAARPASPASSSGIPALRLVNLDAVRAGEARVARHLHPELPADYHEIANVDRRKGAFFSVVLPLVLIANEEVLTERRRLGRIYAVSRTGGQVSRADAAWLAHLARRYDTTPDDIDGLLHRVDVVPPALALAQAAEESGWGTSRFARQGNALFGEWTWTEGEGIVPKGRPAGATYAVRSFDTLLDSVRSYVNNLNTNAAYAELRDLRAAMRAEAEALDASRLAGTLLRYSARGEDYVHSLRAIIRANELEAFTGARLTPRPSFDGA